MSEHITSSYNDALYKSTYTLLYPYKFYTRIKTTAEFELCDETAYHIGEVQNSHLSSLVSSNISINDAVNSQQQCNQ